MVGFFAFWGFLLMKMYFPQDSVFGRTRANIQRELYVQFVNSTVSSVLNSQAVAETSQALASRLTNETLSWAEPANETSSWAQLADKMSSWAALANDTEPWAVSAEGARGLFPSSSHVHKSKSPEFELTNHASSLPDWANHTSGWSEPANKKG